MVTDNDAVQKTIQQSTSPNGNVKADTTHSDTIPFFEPFFSENVRGQDRDSLPHIHSGTGSGNTSTKAELVFTKSIFSNHLLRVKSMEPKSISNEGDYWIPILYLIVFSVYIWIKLRRPQRLNTIFRSLYDNSTLNQLKREENFSMRTILLYLTGCFVCITALFFYKIYLHYRLTFWGINGPLVFGLFFCFLSVLYSGKIILLKFTGHLFECREEIQDYIYNILIFNIIIGIVLIPITLLLYYASKIPFSWLMYTGLAIIAIILIYRILKTLWVNMGNTRIPKFYLFLYFCTLEIIPFLVLFKVITYHLI